MNSNSGHGRRRQDVEPEDAHRGFVTAPLDDADEAVADREMADAERAAVSGTASDEQRRRVETLGEARSQEDRRHRWMDSGSEGSDPPG